MPPQVVHWRKTVDTNPQAPYTWVQAFFTKCLVEIGGESGSPDVWA
jgi:hypothetical protein